MIFRVLLVFLFVVFAFTGFNPKGFCQTSIMKTIEKAEETLDIQPNGTILERLSTVEEKLIGAPCMGTITERCKSIEEYLSSIKTSKNLPSLNNSKPPRQTPKEPSYYSNKTKVEFKPLKKITVSSIPTKPSNKYSAKKELIKPLKTPKPIDIQDVNIDPEDIRIASTNNKGSSQGNLRLKYQYFGGYGDYYNPIEYEPRINCRWYKTPVTVSLYDVPLKYKLDVMRAITKWKKFFPLQIVETKKADVVFKWLSKSELEKEFPGLGKSLGLAYLVSGSGCIYIRSKKKYPKTQLEATVLHELGHILGLGHSPNRQDVMFPVNHAKKGGVSNLMITNIGYIPIIIPTGFRRAKKGTLTISPRDANTLWKLYNNN